MCTTTTTTPFRSRAPRRPRALHALPPRSTHPPAFRYFLFPSFLARCRRDEPRDLLFAFVLQIDRFLLSREIDASQMRISPARLVDGEDAFAFENDVKVIIYFRRRCDGGGGVFVVVFFSHKESVEKSQDPSRGPRARTVKDGHLRELKRPTNGHVFFSSLSLSLSRVCVCVCVSSGFSSSSSSSSSSYACETKDERQWNNVRALSILFFFSPIKILL